MPSILTQIAGDTLWFNRWLILGFMSNCFFITAEWNEGTRFIQILIFLTDCGQSGVTGEDRTLSLVSLL